MPAPSGNGELYAQTGYASPIAAVNIPLLLSSPSAWWGWFYRDKPAFGARTSIDY